MNRNYLVVLCSLAISFLLSSIAVCLPSVGDALNEAAVAERSAARASGVTTIKAEKRDLPSVPFAQPQPEVRTHKWAFDGSNWREEISVGPKPGLIMGSYNGAAYMYFTGAKCMNVYSVASANNKVAPVFAQYIGVTGLPGGTPLASASMAEAQASVAGTDTVHGNPCVVLEAKGQNGQSTKWWLAENYGNRLVKCETRNLPEDKTTYKEKVVTSVFSNFAEKDEGVWMPQQSALSIDLVAHDGSIVNKMKMTATTVYDSVNIPLDPSAIYTEPAPDVKVVSK